MFLCCKGVFKGEQFDAWEIYVNPVCRHDAFSWWLMVAANGSGNSNACRPLSVDRVFNPNRPQMEWLGRVFLMMPTPTFHTRLHSGGEDDDIRTPFGSIMEMGGVTC